MRRDKSIPWPIEGLLHFEEGDLIFHITNIRLVVHISEWEMIVESKSLKSLKLFAQKIYDTYNVILDNDKFSINIIIDVVSRTANRKLLINGDLNQLEWDWKNNSIYLKQNDTIKEICYNRLESQEGYNKNISY